MKANAAVEQKLAMTHDFGRADFCKNNDWFSETNRRMIDDMANHATRVRSHIDRHGLEPVEDFIDACLSLENLIDHHADFIQRKEKRERPRPGAAEEEEAREVPRLRSKGDMEPYINPPAFLEEQKVRLAGRAKERGAGPGGAPQEVVQVPAEHGPPLKRGDHSA